MVLNGCRIQTTLCFLCQISRKAKYSRIVVFTVFFRYVGILIREVTRTVEDIADLDTFLEGAFRDLVSLAVSQVETVGATSFSVFDVPSMSLSISRDQASILLFITADFDYINNS